MAEAIDPRLAAKLDDFTVLPLPVGFTDRLVAAALAEAPGPAPSTLPPLRRSPAARRWLRGGAAGLGAVAVGMISISAAAMGYFGEPIRKAVETAPVIGPVIGKVIERVLPRKARTARHAAPIRPAPAAAAKKAVPAPTATPTANEALSAAPLTREERRQRARAIMADPAARRAWIEAHPEAARRIARRRAVIERRRAAAGLPPRVAPGAEIVPQGAELPLDRPILRRERLSPEQRLELRQRLRERRLRRMEQRADLPPTDPPQP